MATNGNKKPNTQPTVMAKVPWSNIKVKPFDCGMTQQEKAHILANLAVDYHTFHQNHAPTDTFVTNVDIRALDVDYSYQRQFDVLPKFMQEEVDPAMLGMLTVNLRNGRAYVVEGNHRRIMLLSKYLKTGDPAYLTMVRCQILFGMNMQEEAAYFRKVDKMRTPTTAQQQYDAGYAQGDAKITTLEAAMNAHGITMVSNKPTPKGYIRRNAAGAAMSAANRFVSADPQRGLNDTSDYMDWMLEILTAAAWLPANKTCVDTVSIQAFTDLYYMTLGKGDPALFVTYKSNLVDVLSQKGCGHADILAYGLFCHPEYSKSRAYFWTIDGIAKGDCSAGHIKKRINFAPR